MMAGAVDGAAMVAVVAGGALELSWLNRIGNVMKKEFI